MTSTAQTQQEAKCLGCGHAKRNHIDGHGLCLVRSCTLCLLYRPDSGTCAYCLHSGPRAEFVPFNAAGNLACKSGNDCARRQAESAGLDARLRAMAAEVRAASGGALENRWYLADRIAAELGQDYDTSATLAAAYWELAE
jgi:hypothetical protein